MTQQNHQSAPMPERDVSPATGDLDEKGIAELRKVFPKAIARIEQKAAVMAIERALDVVMGEPAWPRAGAIRRRIVADKLRSILDELSPPSSEPEETSDE